MALSLEIKSCARCGGHHRSLLAVPLTGLIDGPRTHYVVCPATEQPLYIDPANPTTDPPPVVQTPAPAAPIGPPAPEAAPAESAQPDQPSKKRK